LPIQEKTVATEAETTLAVVGLSSMTVLRSRFIVPTSTTKASAPMMPNFTTSRHKTLMVPRTQSTNAWAGDVTGRFYLSQRPVPARGSAPVAGILAG